MKRYFTMLLLAIIPTIWGCSAITTREEEDIYTITERDTTFYNFVDNAPGNRDNGIIYPSSRTFDHERTMIQRDSTVTRYYPDFIRLGVFESVGLIGTSANHGLDWGLFGVYPDFENIRENYTGKSNLFFTGGIYRFGIGEWRLRWFRDAKNWTIGTDAFEMLIPEVRTEYWLSTVFPLYIRKRFYLREEIPYISVTPSLGIGWYPWMSQYINLSASLDVGSIGGLNARLYVGWAGGTNSKNTPQIRGSENPDKSVSVTFPYVGIGMSVLDFHNLVPETYKEWKDHEHSSWDVGLVQLSFLTSNSLQAFGSVEKDKNAIFTGYMFRLANASVAIPILNNQIYAGTSLISFIGLGNSEWGLGILPFRLGYWQTVLADELSTEPFVEYSYYPSVFTNIGNRLNFRISDALNIHFILGYVTGNPYLGFGKDFNDQFGKTTEFSNFYFGFGCGIGDRIFFPEHLRYNK